MNCRGSCIQDAAATATSTAIRRGLKWDEQDIRYAVEHGESLADTANFLCRTMYEVRDKAKQMGLIFKR